MIVPLPLQHVDRLYTSESDVFICQNLMYTVRVNIFQMAVDP